MVHHNGAKPGTKSKSASRRPGESNALPIDALLDDIRAALRQRDELVLQAAPGAGKTTRVPLALLAQPWLGRQKILLLEPRRMAARTAAERMASLLGEACGETVGYRMRQHSRVGPKTRIEVITEGVLTRQLQSDPELQGVGLVIFDEFHERNLNSDLGLALTLQARALLRDDSPLKLLIMSATLEGLDFTRLLGDAPRIVSAGRSFPVTLHYAETVKTGEPIEPPVVKAILRAVAETDGSILVFLPGQREIRRVQQRLQPQLDASLCIRPLYGALSLEQQMAAIRPLDETDACRRKIVLATDIAETSITIDDVSTVVDSGLSRQPGFDPVTGMTRLHTRRISRASSVQRMGRAGRTRAGHCYRLWSESTQAGLRAQTPAEILQADLCPLALQLLQWGVNDVDELSWLDRPPAAALQQAQDLLQALGATEAIGANGHLRLSPHGEQMAQLPLHPRLAHMLIKAAGQGYLPQAAALAALLSEKDPLRQYGADIAAKVDVLLGDIPCESQHKGWLHYSRRQMKAYQAVCRNIKAQEDIEITPPDAIGWLISLAYPDRIAQRRRDEGLVYRLSNGRAARFSALQKLAQFPYLAIAEMGGLAGQREDGIYAAAPLNAALFEHALAPLLTQQAVVEWDERSGKMLAEQRTLLGRLIIHRAPMEQIPAQVRAREILALVRKKGLSLLRWRDDAQLLCDRVQSLRQHAVASGCDTPWPDFSEAGLLQSLEQWLLPAIDAVRRLDDLHAIDWRQCLMTLLPWPLPQRLDELAPLTIAVPTGSLIKIDYSQSPPVLAVKLQEMFGCQQTPAIANGRIPLLLHLLSPARKPLQITQDLEAFWQGSYAQVKKEMKGRYPKHPWPDDPLQALPTRYTKHRKPG